MGFGGFSWGGDTDSEGDSARVPLDKLLTAHQDTRG